MCAESREETFCDVTNKESGFDKQALLSKISHATATDPYILWRIQACVNYACWVNQVPKITLHTVLLPVQHNYWWWRRGDEIVAEHPTRHQRLGLEPWQRSRKCCITNICTNWAFISIYVTTNSYFSSIVFKHSHAILSIWLFTKSLSFFLKNYSCGLQMEE